VGSRLSPCSANQSPSRRCRRERPQMAARLVPRRPAVVETSTSKVTQCPGPDSTAACSTARGPDATTPDASVSLQRRRRHPGAHATAKDRLEPRHTNRRGLDGPKRLTTDKSQRAPARLAPYRNPHEPPPRPGFATEETASSKRSQSHPGTARPSSTLVFHQVSSATCRLSASATRCHPGTPAPHPIPNWNPASRAPIGWLHHE
jgi:hypothetical protein